MESTNTCIIINEQEQYHLYQQYQHESCLCHRAALINMEIDRRLLLESQENNNDNNSNLSLNYTAGNSRPNPNLARGANLRKAGDSIKEAIEARKYAQEIARNNPKNPVTAIANACWENDPKIMRGDSLTALAPFVYEKYGPVLSMLTFANTHCVDTSEGIVMIDCGTKFQAPRISKAAKDVLKKKLHTAIYTHGHIDHIGVNFMPEFKDDNYRVVAHENVVGRFDRYIKTNGYNTIINQRQFQLPKESYQFQNEFRYPDLTYSDYLRFDVGEETFELFHGKGETNDATIIWMPKHRYCFVGDFFIWNAPNAGNPQKVQRFPEEWAEAAAKVLSLNPKIVFAGHGPPIIGEERVQEAFSNQKKLLDEICQHALNGMNAGKSLGEIMRTTPINKSLISKPYLQPKYDDPRWFVATLWRRYAGWYTFDVRHLLPVDASDVGTELAKLVGSAEKLAKHAEKIMTEGGDEKLGIALEIAEYAAAAAGASTETHLIRSKILRAMEKRETTLMASSIYRAAAQDSEAKL